MIVDLHSHILPGVDDGAPTMEYALQMLQNAVASDVKVLAVTPHCTGLYGNYLDIQRGYGELARFLVPCR